MELLLKTVHARVTHVKVDDGWGRAQPGPGKLLRKVYVDSLASVDDHFCFYSLMSWLFKIYCL